MFMSIFAWAAPLMDFIDGSLVGGLAKWAETWDFLGNGALKSLVLDGMIAFFTLAGAEKPALAELAKKLSLSCVDRTITLYFQADPQEIVSFLKEQAEAKKRKAGQTAQ